MPINRYLLLKWIIIAIFCGLIPGCATAPLDPKLRNYVLAVDQCR